MNIQITIVMNEVGQFQVNGPLENEFLVRGMLQKALNTIDVFYAKQASESRILKPVGPVPPLTGINGGKDN